MICPKCGYSRKTKETVPDGQCPSCGVYYAKVGAPVSTASRPDLAAKSGGGGAWMLAKAAVAAAAVAGILLVVPTPRWLQAALHGGGTPPGQAAERKLSELDFSRSRIVMYSLSDCEYCADMRQKFQDNRIPFTEYFLDMEPARVDELTQKLHAAGFQGGGFGTPTLEVNGRMMPNNPPFRDVVRQAAS